MVHDKGVFIKIDMFTQSMGVQLRETSLKLMHRVDLWLEWL